MSPPIAHTVGLALPWPRARRLRLQALVDQRRVPGMRRWLLLAVLLAACGPDRAPPSSRWLPVPLGDSPQRPAGAAWVTVVEFSDFECPYCRSEEPVVQRLGARYGADLRVVYKHLPLHAYSTDAAAGAECAGEQGLFWEMHDALFALPVGPTWVDDAAGAVAGLDLTLWNGCFAQGAVLARVDADAALARQLGVRGTPTFAVNGHEVLGAVEESQLAGVIDAALAEARASGVPEADYYDQVVLGL